MMTPTVGISDFLRSRMATELPFSHFEGTEDELIELVRKNFDKAKPGYRDGVLLVPVDPSGSFSPVCNLSDGDRLVGTYEPRRPGEAPRMSVFAEDGKKFPAAACSIILYSIAVLEEGNEPRTGMDYDCVMIQARTHEGDEPIDPTTLMHNHFGSDGGTNTKMSPEEFESALRECFLYWKDRALLSK